MSKAKSLVTGVFHKKKKALSPVNVEPKQKKEKKAKNAKKTDNVKTARQYKFSLQSLSAKIRLMGTVSLITIIVLCLLGVFAFYRRNQSSKLESNINDIVASHAQNKSLETWYQVYVSDQYLKDIVTNLENMAATVQKLINANSTYKAKEIEMQQNIRSSKECYEKMIQVADERGYSKDKGLYASYMDVTNTMHTSLAALTKAAAEDTGNFNFNKEFNDIDKGVAEYSRLVLLGSDVSSAEQEISSHISRVLEALPNKPKYAAVTDQIRAKLKEKQEILSQMKQKDQEMTEIKSNNSTYSLKISKASNDIKEEIEKSTKKSMKVLVAFVIIIFCASTVVVFGFTFFIGRGIRKRIKEFRSTLNEVIDGNINVRANVSRKDEFSEFGLSINQFLDKMCSIVNNLQNISASLNETGKVLDLRASDTNEAVGIISGAFDDISAGAVSQAEDVEQSSIQISDMGQVIQDIIEKVNVLSTSTEEMQRQGVESAKVMEELSTSNENAMEAFDKIDRQIRMTDQSVQQIHEAVNLITSIADETNLLSLNASIEAARAGEAGRGFAVVASAIQKLAEQSNSSAKIIDDTIAKLSQESQLTVKTMEEITQIVNVQKEKLTLTRKEFMNVSDGIKTTGEEIINIKEQAGVCDKAREKTIESITNLSAISEENAASTQQTSASVQDLTMATNSLAETARELKELSDRLNEDLTFFKLS